MKDIQGWEGKYAVTIDGRIWAHERDIATFSRWGTRITKHYRGRWLATNTTARGDWYLSISFGTKVGRDRKGYKVHRLVARAFIPNPNKLPEVNHKNGIKTDNRVENLEWCSRRDNLAHARSNGWIPDTLRGAENTNAKLSWEQAEEIRREYIRERTPHRKLCLRYGVSFATIGDIIRGKRYVKDDLQSFRTKGRSPLGHSRSLKPSSKDAQIRNGVGDRV